MREVTNPYAGHITIMLVIVGAACVAAFLIGLGIDAPLLRVIVKPVPVLCLTIWLVISPRAGGFILVSAGLVFSAIGDILLAAIDLGADPELFFGLGLGAFLIAHLWYIAAFVKRDCRLHLPFLAPFFIWGVAVFVVIRPNLGALTIPVLVYIIVISTMLWRATCLAGPGGRRVSLAHTAGWGAVFFGFSDSVIAINKFHEPFDAAPYAIIMTYWFGQIGIALSARTGGRTKTV